LAANSENAPSPPAPKELRFAEEGRSYRAIARELDLSKNTVMGIVQRNRSKNGNPQQTITRRGLSYETTHGAHFR
jgi:transposase